MKPGKFDCDNLECKPCPCCAGPAKIQRSDRHDLQPSMQKPRFFQAYCMLCWLSTEWYDLPGSAQAAWNKRPDNDTIRRLLDSVKELLEAVNVAFEFDESDVFGVHHNDTVDRHRARRATD